MFAWLCGWAAGQGGLLMAHWIRGSDMNADPAGDPGTPTTEIGRWNAVRACDVSTPSSLSSRTPSGSAALAPERLTTTR